MTSTNKTKAQLVEELEALRIQLAELEHSAAERADEALREGELRYQLLFESAPDAYYLNDRKGTFLDGNKAAEELSGYQREELIGKSFLKLNLLSPKQLPKAAALLAQNVLPS